MNTIKDNLSKVNDFKGFFPKNHIRIPKLQTVEVPKKRVLSIEDKLEEAYKIFDIKIKGKIESLIDGSSKSSMYPKYNKDELYELAQFELNKIKNIKSEPMTRPEILSAPINDFHKIADDDIEVELPKIKNKELNKLVPSIHRSYVIWIIKNQFKGNEEKYISTIPLFFENFTKKDRATCDDGISKEDKTRAERKKLGKHKRQMILYSAQLLKLMGNSKLLGAMGMQRKAILNDSSVKFYKDEMIKTDEFIAQYRLINSAGKIIKLTSNEKKQKQKIAQILKISSCLSKQAIDKGFTYQLITLTLPPCYHSNAGNNANSFRGFTPQESLDKINGYWKAIRANLSKKGLVFGDEIFGLQVFEMQADSTLHMHTIIYSSYDDVEIIGDVVKGVQNRNNKTDDIKEKVRFDIKVSDGRASGATYLFKYITKSFCSYASEDVKDDNAVKNQACRYLYGARGFNFFGLKGSITKFNFIQTNYLTYKNHFPKELTQIFKDGDYYEFIKNYQEFFDNEYYKNDKGVKKFLGVVFKKSELQCKIKGIKANILDNEIVLIEKKQFCIFENSQNEDGEIFDVEYLDLDSLVNANINRAYIAVNEKQEKYDLAKGEFIKRTSSTVNLQQDYKNEWLEKLTKRVELQLFNIIQENQQQHQKHSSLYEHLITKDDCDMCLVE